MVALMLAVVAVAVVVAVVDVVADVVAAAAAADVAAAGELPRLQQHPDTFGLADLRKMTFALRAVRSEIVPAESNQS